MKDSLKKGILFWGSITVVTFLITYFSCVSNITAEESQNTDEVAIHYEDSYNNAVEARDLLNAKKYLEVQKKIDAGRVSIGMLKSLTEENSPESISGNTWSVILDDAQEGLYSVISAKIKEYKEMEVNNEKKESLKKEINDILVTLENSSVEKAKIKAAEIRTDFENVLNS